MIYIHLIEIFIILLFLVLYIYTKKYRKIIIYKISKILVVIGIILTIFPYNLVLSFKDPIKAYQFYNGKTKYVEIIEENKEVIFIYQKRGEVRFATYYQKNKRWKENIKKSLYINRETINTKEYLIKSLELENGRILTVILENKNNKNVDYKSIMITKEEMNIKIEKENVLYYKISEKKESVNIDGKKVNIWE